MTHQPHLTVRLRRNGVWTATAADRHTGRYTVVEGSADGAARAVVFTGDRCAEALVGTQPSRRGPGHLRLGASLDAAGRFEARAERTFGSGTMRRDHLRLGAGPGEQRSTWFFPDGSRAEAGQLGDQRTIGYLASDGTLLARRESRLTRLRGGAVGVFTEVRDGAGEAIGVAQSTLTRSRGSMLRVIEQRFGSDAEGDGSITTTHVGPAGSGHGRQGASSTTRPDGSGSITTWTNYGDHGSEHETSWGPGQSNVSDRQTGWNNTNGHSNGSTTTGSDGSSTSSQGWTGKDGNWNFDSESRDSAGNVVGRSSTTANEDVSSTTRIEYDDKGGGVIITTTVDRRTGEVTGSIVGFDKNGNPTNPGAGGPSGGGSGGGGGDDGGGDDGGDDGGGDDGGGDDGGDDGGGDDGGDDGPDDGGGGGDEMPTDDGGSEDDMGPSFHFGGSGRLGGLGDFGDIFPGGPLGGGGDDDFGDGDGTGRRGPARFERVKGALLAAAQSTDPDQGGGPDDGPRGREVHLSGSAALIAVSSGKVPTDDWGDYNDPRVLVAFVADVVGVSVGAAGQAAALAVQMVD